MKIVFDMDNTLTDDFGKEVRPGIVKLLSRLKKEGFSMVLWTSSTKGRAREILSNHKLSQYFSEFIFREDYDPKRENLPKDIRTIKGDFLVDDDPRQIKFLNSFNIACFQITPFRAGRSTDQTELDKRGGRLAPPLLE
jgi:hydroxymethylpyrimidine pyrophosphatase-like HAD family hydrolase